MESIKLKRKYIIIMVLTLIVSVATLTFAYFQGSVLNDLINPTKVSTGSIDIKISDTSVNATDVEPLFTNGNNFEKASFVKHFSVTNGTNTLNTCVELYLKVNSIDSGLANSYFRYAVVNDETGTTITGSFDGASNGSNIDLGSLYFFEKGTIKEYTMYIWIEYDSNTNQASMLNKSMNATLFVKAQDTKTKDSCDNRKNFKLTYVTYGDDGCNNVTVAKGEGVTLCSPTKADREFKGWYTDSKYTNQVTSLTNMSDDVKLYAKWNCSGTNLTFVQGEEFINGQYTYRYMQEGVPTTSGLSWKNIKVEGWGVQLTDKTSTDDITTDVCTFIKDKPVISMSYMFSDSQATTLDLSSFDTSNVTNMSSMFHNSQATTLDLSSFDTSNVTNMSGMFGNTKFTSIGLSSFNTSNVTNMNFMFYNSQATRLDLSSFNTSKVTDMEAMFYNSQATTLDLSNFTITSSTEITSMFSGAAATTGYAKDAATATLFNDSSTTSIPDTLKFTVK